MSGHRRDAVAPRCLVDPFHHPIDTVRDLDNRQSVFMTFCCVVSLTGLQKSTARLAFVSFWQIRRAFCEDKFAGRTPEGSTLRCVPQLPRHPKERLR
jgi:hypothetical protein